MKSMKQGSFVKISDGNSNSEYDWKVMALSEDELMLAKSDWIDRESIVLATRAVINGTKFQVGDKVSIVTKDKRKIEMFISYITDKNTITLSLKKKKPSYRGLGWLLNMLKS